MMIKTKTASSTLESICAHADHPKGDPYGSHVMPLYQISTFGFKNAEAGRKFFAGEKGGASHGYSRLGNPTVQRVEETFSQLETFDSEFEAETLLFGSGMAAMTTALMAIGAGRRILAKRCFMDAHPSFYRKMPKV